MLRTGPWHPGSQLSTAGPELRQAWALIRNTRPPPPPGPSPKPQLSPGAGCALLLGMSLAVS